MTHLYCAYRVVFRIFVGDHDQTFVFFRSVRHTINNFVHFDYHKRVLSPCKLIAWFRRK